MGSQNAGKVMAWVGTALYAGFGFLTLAVAATLIPLLGLPLLTLTRPVTHPQRKGSAQFMRVAGAVWVPGVGVALSGVGLGAISTFMVLLYAARGWSPAWLPFTILSLAFIGGSLVFGHLPDRAGGARVALVCILIEAGGQALIWSASSSMAALCGVSLTGFGYSLVCPGFGVEAIRRATQGNRGLAMGAYTAFLDISLGITGPTLGLVAGLVAGWADDLNAVFLASTATVACAALVALRLMMQSNDASWETCLMVGESDIPFAE